MSDAVNEIKPGVLRTPDECFANIPDFPFQPNYVDVNGLRVHYLDEGPKDADPILLMHGEPSWCFLYRKMIPGLVAAGHRCIAPESLDSASRTNSRAGTTIPISFTSTV